MNLGFLGGNSEEKLAQARVLEHEQGYTSCEKCKTRVAIDGCEPLSMGQCPNCNDLIFVPWRLADWWVTRPIAAGGFGAVYLGRSRAKPAEKVAVKVLQRTEQVTAEVMDDFLRESDLAYSLEPHPHIVDTYAVGEEDNRAFMVQNFIDGKRLNDLVESRSTYMPGEECVYYGLDIASALRHIHQAGYVYRDVKPENILITSDNMAILIDLGLCTTIEQAAQPNCTGIVGSPLYMAPERYLREGDDLRSDIYSLGMVLYFTLNKESYFTPTELRQVMKGHTSQLRLSTGAKMPRCNTHVVELVDRMIRRHPEERFASYEELMRAMFEVLQTLQQTTTSDPILQRRRSHFFRTYVA